MQVVVIGGPRQVTKAFFEHLKQEGMTLLEYQEDSCRIAPGAEGIININTCCSHNLTNDTKAAADAMGIPYASVDHKWLKARPILVARGFIQAPAPPVVTGQEDSMSSAGENGTVDLQSQVKAIVGPLVTETKEQLRKFKEQLDAMEALLSEAHVLEVGKIKGQLAQITKDMGNCATAKDLEECATTEEFDALVKRVAGIRQQLDADRVRLKHDLELLKTVATPGPEILEKIPVSTRLVAEELLGELQGAYPHPITRVRWEDAAKASGVKPETLVEALTLLHADAGLNERCLAVLHRCGWKLALIQPDKPPRVWMLDGSSFELPVATVATPEAPPPSVQPPPVAPVLPEAPKPVKHPVGHAGFGTPEDNSSSGKIFQVVQLNGRPMTHQEIKAATGFRGDLVSKCLWAMLHAKLPRHGFRLASYPTPDGKLLYGVEPVQA